jgi:ubiquinone/menaquinone biosynthesis C-methylase UbiE
MEPKAVSRQDNQTYYDEFSATYERERHQGYHAFIDALESDIVLRYAQEIEGAKVLEAGCGTGLILKTVAPKVGAAVGIDLSRGMLQKARARQLTVGQASVTALPFADESFDVVCSFKVLAHVEAIEQALLEFHRVLRPGGRLIAEFYNTWSLRYLIKRLKGPTTIASSGTHDEAIYTRYDSLAQIRSYLPAGLRFERVHGVRVLTPVSGVHKVPVLGSALRSAERVAAELMGVRRLGGFLVVVAQKQFATERTN